MRIHNTLEQQVLGTAMAILSLSLGATAALATLLASDHMAGVVGMCGQTSGHCGLCLAAVALFVAALGVSGAGVGLMGSSPPTTVHAQGLRLTRIVKAPYARS